MITDDTIVAISSAVGPSARIVVRLSGGKAVGIARAIAADLRAKTGTGTVFFLQFASLRFPAWVYIFPAPGSYTGEDVVEFHLPGNPVLAQLLLLDLLKRGARLAEPGEFTARAYFAGKLDLTEAEAVAASIAANNHEQLQAARQLMAGELSHRLGPIIDLLAQTLGLIEVGIDFSEEDVTFLPTDEINRRVEEIDERLARLLEDSARFGRLNHEPRILFVGRPNAGKSTLINALTNRKRAVVSSISGTTRDVLSAPLELASGQVQLMDIAGIEETAEGQIQMQMQERAQQAIEISDHVVLVIDVTTRLAPSLSRLAELVIYTKTDLPHSPVPLHEMGIAVSATNGAGLHQLKDTLNRLVFGENRAATKLALNDRHIGAIEEARAALQRARQNLDGSQMELIAAELREALDALGRILGGVTPDDVLGRIFSTFCIGK